MTYFGRDARCALHKKPQGKNPKEGKIMMNKLASAMVVASLSALPMTSAYAQSASGSNNAQPATGQKGNGDVQI